MMRRARFTSGLLLLMGMALSMVEGIAAVACGADFRAGDSPTDHLVHADDMGSMSTGHDCPPQVDDDAPEPTSDERGACPFTFPGASQGCAFAASLPASGVELSSKAALSESAALVVETTPLTNPVGSIFRPPIA